MASVNKTILLGNLGKDPELKHTQSNMAVCNLWMATTETTTKDGQKKEHTEWHSVVAWDKTAENCAKFLTKGSPILVEGRISYREYTDKDGSKRKQTEIVANIVKFLASKSDGQSQQSSSSQQNGQQQQEMSSWDSIPF